MRIRAWTFTCFDLSFDWQALFENDDSITYLAYAHETCPTTGRHHKQGWLYLRNGVRSLRSKIGTIHHERMYGTFAQNDAYCSKEGDLIEFGRKPRQGERRDIAEIMEAVADGETSLQTAEKTPALWCQYGRRFDEYRRLLIPRRTWKTEVFVYWGEPGTGKTERCWEQAPDADIVSFANGFVVGYRGGEDVIFDDFEDSQIPRGLFLQLTDKYPMVINVKNGEMNWAPKRVFITSNFNPKYWYTGCKAVARRLTAVHNTIFEN